MDDATLRRDIVAQARAMNALGINQGTSGNISLRCGSTMLITPSATPYDEMRPDQIAAMPLDGAQQPTWTGPLKPSTEWRFRREIPAVHYMPYCLARQLGTPPRSPTPRSPRPCAASPPTAPNPPLQRRVPRRRVPCHNHEPRRR